jgi:hypothetical protein
MDVLSPKSLFYLEHQDQINTWANLESQVAKELHQWLCSWAEAMQEGESDEARLLFQLTEEVNLPKLLWYRDDWRVDLDSPGAQAPIDDAGETAIHAGLGMEWQKKSPHRNNNIYVGIWVNLRMGTDGNQSLKQKIVRDVEERLGLKQIGTWWPYYRYIDPLGPYIGNRMGVQRALDDPDVLDAVLKEYQQEQLQALEGLWDQCADLIDDAVREHT